MNYPPPKISLWEAGGGEGQDKNSTHVCGQGKSSTDSLKLFPRRLTETISKGKNLMFNNKTKGKKPKPKGEEGEDHAASEEDGELGECSA